MNVLIINAIVYTAESEKISRANSIKDTMIYDLCLAFHEAGHNVVLYAAEPYKPLCDEKYPFDVIWGECKFNRLFKPHRIPFMPGLYRYLRENHDSFDLIISSEVFSLCSLMAVGVANKKLLIWHELAKHNKMLRGIPSHIWYNVIARICMRNTRVVARSVEAKDFIGKYCINTLDEIIDHGVNLSKFIPAPRKEDSFVVCSQLIARKRVDGILGKFSEYIKKTGAQTRLYIIGDGDQKAFLQKKSKELLIEDQVVFLGRMCHEELIEYLSKAKALLINTVKDNSMISIVESIAVGTPVVTTEVPLNVSYIKKYKLGIAAEWTDKDLIDVVKNNDEYVRNCLSYRKILSNDAKVREFIDISSTESHIDGA